MSEFFEMVMRRLLSCRRERQSDNFDFDRFSFDGVDRSTEFNADYHEQALSVFAADHERFEETWNSLADQQSRDLLFELILWRLASHLHVKLSTNNPSRRALYQRALTLPSVPSRLNVTGIFGPLRHFEDVQVEGCRLKIDSYPAGLAYAFFMKQYFFERDGIVIRPSPGQHVIDGGALFGDTALAFAVAVGDTGRVYAFDPLGSHAEVVQYNVNQNGFQDRIRFFPVGLGDIANGVTGPIDAGGVVNPGFSLGATAVPNPFPLRTVDSLVSSGTIERVDFLKLDIEALELAALKGAEQTLCEFRPNLAISLYHKFSDFFEIPAFISSLGLGYRFYLDHYTIHSEETVLYGLTGPG